jgi:hypothetical protein
MMAGKVDRPSEAFKQKMTKEQLKNTSKYIIGIPSDNKEFSEARKGILNFWRLFVLFTNHIESTQQNDEVVDEVTEEINKFLENPLAEETISPALAKEIQHFCFAALVVLKYAQDSINGDRDDKEIQYYYEYYIKKLNKDLKQNTKAFANKEGPENWNLIKVQEEGGKTNKYIVILTTEANCVLFFRVICLHTNWGLNFAGTAYTGAATQLKEALWSCFLDPNKVLKELIGKKPVLKKPRSYNGPLIEGHYEGDWINGRRHGFGIMTYTNGEIYEGDWINGRRCGFGIMTYPQKDNENEEGDYARIYHTQDQYAGEWKQNKRHGWGVMAYSICETRVSAYINYLSTGRSGPDKVSITMDAYLGEWENDQKHGFGEKRVYTCQLYRDKNEKEFWKKIRGDLTHKGEWEQDDFSREAVIPTFEDNLEDWRAKGDQHELKRLKYDVRMNGGEKSEDAPDGVFNIVASLLD